MGFDAPDRRQLEGDIEAGHIVARTPQHTDHALSRIGRAADDLERLAAAVVHRKHLQLVGLRMLLGGQHLCDRERPQPFRRIIDGFDLKADAGQGFGDLGRVRLGVEMFAKPGE